MLRRPRTVASAMRPLVAPSALTVFAPVSRLSGATTVAVKRPCPLVRMVVVVSASPLSASVSSSLGPKPLPETRTRSPACALVGTSARRGALVAALVGVGVRVGATVGVRVGATGGSSTAPISQASGCRGLGRGCPRWSVLTEQVARGTASRAGLPGCGAMVQVGPPLSARGPRRGSSGRAPLPVRSPAALNPLQPFASLMRLLLSEVTVPVPAQSGPLGAVFPARMVAFNTAVLPASAKMPPPAGAVFALMVLKLTGRPPVLAIAPPLVAAGLALRVLWVMLGGPPPPATSAARPP